MKTDIFSVRVSFYLYFVPPFLHVSNWSAGESDCGNKRSRSLQRARSGVT